MERDRPDMVTRPAEGCILAVALCCFFWAGVLLLVAWRWGWLW